MNLQCLVETFVNELKDNFAAKGTKNGTYFVGTVDFSQGAKPVRAHAFGQRTAVHSAAFDLTSEAILHVPCTFSRDPLGEERTIRVWLWQGAEDLAEEIFEHVKGQVHRGSIVEVQLIWTPRAQYTSDSYQTFDAALSKQEYPIHFHRYPSVGKETPAFGYTLHYQILIVG